MLYALFYGFHKFIVSLHKCTFLLGIVSIANESEWNKWIQKSDYWSEVMSTITMC